MPAYNFQKRFATKVESGEKCQTIRRRRKRPTKPGEVLYLYAEQRSKNARKLREAKCVRVLPIEIELNTFPDQWRVKVGLEWISKPELDDFARADGFADAADFFGFWMNTHGLELISKPELDDFARADGFADAADFFGFWMNTHGLEFGKPLTGFELIQWEPKPK